MEAPGEFNSGASVAQRRISARVGAIEESATLAVAARAAAMRAAGAPVIGFGAGEPDFPTPDHIVEAAARACADVRYHRYTPNAGLPELREAIAEKTKRDSGLDVSPHQVLVTNGGKQAVFQALATLLDPGDEVLLPAPYWVTYPEAVRLAGAEPVVVPTGPESGYRVGVADLEAARTERTRLLVFASPSNPTGAVYPPEEVEAIGRWAVEHDVWVLTDEIYEHLVYGDARFVSMPAVVPDLADRCVVANAVSKTYAMTGWRVGWMIAPLDVTTAAANLQSHLTSNVGNVAQAAALAAIEGPQDSVGEMRSAFDRRRRLVHGLLSAIPGIECPEPHGAFYVLPSIEGLFGRDFGGRRPASSFELAEVLLDVAQVAVVPGEPFGAPACARLSYAMSDADIQEGVARIAAAVEAAEE
jgi:aspartate/methionine/tyrosine aminotransferase